MEEKKLQVEYWRVEFSKQRKRIGKRWRAALCDSSQEFCSDEGRRLLDAVSDGRANLPRTAKVVEALKKIKVQRPAKKSE